MSEPADPTAPGPGSPGEADPPLPPPADPAATLSGPEALAASAPGPVATASEGAPVAHGERGSPYDHLLRIRGEVSGTTGIGLFLAGLTAFLLLWGVLTAGEDPLVTPFLLPSPGDVMRTAVELTTGPSETEQSGVVIQLPAYQFRWGLASTLGRTSIGFLVAALICFPLGVLSGAFPPLKRMVAPVEVAGGYTPPVALLPLGAALVGALTAAQLEAKTAYEIGRIGFLVVVISFWLYPLITAEIEAVDEVFINTAYTLGASRWQVIRRVLIPVSLGNIWEHLRVTYAVGWASIILAEAYMAGKIPGETGIGFFMAEVERRHHMDKYFTAVLAIIATGIVVDYAFKVLGRKLFPYREAR